MLKSILSLEGAKFLTKSEQSQVLGGGDECNPEPAFDCHNPIKYHLGNGCWYWICDGEGPGGPYSDDGSPIKK